MTNKEKFENDVQENLDDNTPLLKVDDEINDDSFEKIDENEEKIYQLDIKMQELLISLEKIENQYSADEYYELESNEEYINLREEYKTLEKEKKELLKELRKKDTSKLSQVSIWVIVYGIIMLIISFPVVTLSTWTDFAVWVINLFSESFANLNTNDFLIKVIQFLVIFSLPLLINLVTWIVHNNFIKTKLDRKVFIGFWIVQGLMSLGVLIYLCVLLYGAGA